MMRKIHVPSELSSFGWEKSQKKKDSPHVSELIDRFNMTSFWVATEINTAHSSKDQAALIKKFIKIANVFPTTTPFFLTELI